MDLDQMMTDARSRDFIPVPLPVKLKAHMVSKIRPFRSNNVLAMLPGRTAKLKDEAVMYTAHYDHLGIRPDMPGDNIYNGADDNATGCGILLEMARAYSLARKGRAARSCSPRSLPKSKGCSARSISASIHRFRPGKSRLI